MNVAVYIRVSTDEQAEQGISIPAQKSRLLAYCRAQGWKPYDFYIDDGFSGKDIARPAMQRLIDDAQENKFNAVLVLKLDRLSRRQKDVLYLLEDIFEPCGIGFKSATESFDTTTPFGKAAIGMMAVFAQLERETIVERVRMAKKESARQGRFMGGPVPYGYKYNFAGKKLETDEIQAQTVRNIYDYYLHGKFGYSEIAGELERRGVPGPTNRRWNKSSVRKILSNPVYAGMVKHKGTLYPGQHEAIIDTEKWREVQALMHHRGAARSMTAVHAGLLSGIIWCGECGARMRVKNTWQNYPCVNPKRIVRYYVCYSQDKSAAHMVRKHGCACGYKRADEIESRVIQELHRFSDNRELVQMAIDESLANAADTKTLLRGINQAGKDIEAVDKKMERWYAAFEQGALELDEFMARVKALRSKKTYLQRLITEFETGLKADLERKFNTKEIMEILLDFSSIWEEASEEERHIIINNTIGSVKVYRDNRLEISYNL